MFVDAVRACIDAHAMIPVPSTVLIAVSGGADSMALLTALYRLRDVYQMQLVVAHVDHQLRQAEARRDATFVQHQSAHLGLPFHYLRVDAKAWQRKTGLSPQHAAREQRYAALSAVQQVVGASRIALGHMADDQAESVLLRLARGTSPAGLAGIPPVNLPCIRPLITVSRQMIQGFLQAEDIPWVEDSSNASRVYLRNQVRHELLPILRQANPQVDGHLNELANMMAAENAFLDAQVDILYRQAVTPQPGFRFHLRRTPCKRAPLALQRRLLRRVLEAALPEAVTATFQHTEALRQLVVAGLNGQRLTLPGGWLAECSREGLWLWLERAALSPELNLGLSVPGQLEIPSLGLQLTSEMVSTMPTHLLTVAEVATSAQRVAQKQDVAYIDASQLQLPLTVRLRQPGDRFHPYGASGSKKLSAFLIDKKVPRVERDRIPLVLSGAHIIWVAGYQIADTVKVHPHTHRVVRLHRTWL